ncbi:MAG: TIM barrel protein, partial [Cyanothece sp. SIO1E1]|nr:TIM barrel protein [Cyanothece sp. SIO1E1]
QAIEKHSLRMGAMVFNMNFESPTLVANTEESRTILKDELNTALEAAKRANATVMTTLSGISDPRLPEEIQTINMIENLRWLGDEVAKHNLTLGVEAITARNWPGVFLKSTRKALQLVTAVDHPHVRLIFDVFQAQVEDGDLLRGLEEAWEKIAMIQLADAPHRTEPGSGEINFQNLLQLIHDKGFDGLVELEHAHSIDGLAGEKNSLEIWKELDRRIR